MSSPERPHVSVVHGDLLTQPVEVIVSAWNRNIIPWWLLLPQGVSGAIKRHAGNAPFREVARHGPLPLGSAILTGAGRLPYRAIIHVAGIDLVWRASEFSVRASVRSALALAEQQAFASIAFPLIGAGSGRVSAARVEAWMLDELRRARYAGQVRLVRYAPSP